MGDTLRKEEGCDSHRLYRGTPELRSRPPRRSDPGAHRYEPLTRISYAEHNGWMKYTILGMSAPYGPVTESSSRSKDREGGAAHGARPHGDAGLSGKGTAGPDPSVRVDLAPIPSRFLASGAPRVRHFHRNRSRRAPAFPTPTPPP